MKTIHKLGILLLMLVTLFLAGGWQGGNVSSSTVNAVAFNNVTTTGVSATFQNIGQASHWLTFCPDANVATIGIELEGSYDNVTWFAISPPGSTADAGCVTLEAGGYFPYVRANLTGLTGASAHVTAYYSGSSFPIPGGGISQLGKSSQPATFVATNLVSNNLGTACSFQSGLSGPLVLYGFKIYSNATSQYFLDIQDSVTLAEIGPIVVPAGAVSQDVPLPAIGTQFSGTLQVRTCTGTGGSGSFPSFNAGGNIYFNVFYKNNPIVSTKVGSNGVVSGQRRGQ